MSRKQIDDKDLQATIEKITDLLTPVFDRLRITQLETDLALTERGIDVLKAANDKLKAENDDLRKRLEYVRKHSPETPTSLEEVYERDEAIRRSNLTYSPAIPR